MSLRADAGKAASSRTEDLVWCLQDRRWSATQCRYHKRLRKPHGSELPAARATLLVRLLRAP